VLAVVEVKRRTTLEEALAAVTPVQRERLVRAARGAAAEGLRPGVRLDLFAARARGRSHSYCGAGGRVRCAREHDA
jgi:Holliday junction resolvase-like predicted endonuclease